MHDTDCAAGQACACHGSAYTSTGNTCLAGDCRVDSDCGAGGYCSPAYNTASCGGLLGYFCHTAKDQCIDDSDCSTSSGLQVCTYSKTSGTWQCAARLLCP
jgi:Cys-rich repeat protein